MPLLYCVMRYTQKKTRYQNDSEPIVILADATFLSFAHKNEVSPLK